MNHRLDEVKVMRDPIHGYIHVSDSLIWDLINSREFQRLRRIKQLGGVHMVYHTAEHSRFCHCLGVYEICRRMIEEVQGMDKYPDETLRLAALSAALLHDLGHGPMSHFFESISGIDHEKMGCDILMDPSTQVHEILASQGDEFPAMVQDILLKTGKYPLAEQMISSQLDCDRMDYLLRDAYETGTSYGSFDLERILRTLRVHDGVLCIKKSGMHSVEDYIMARYQMYWQVYLHPDSWAYEQLIFLFFRRYEVIRSEHPMEIFEPIYRKPLEIREFLKLEDFRMMTGFAMVMESEDEILADLAKRIVERRLFDWKTGSEEEVNAMREKVMKAGYDPDFYFSARQTPLQEYLPYREGSHNAIYVLDEGKLSPLSDSSAIAKALLKVETVPSMRMCFPKGI